MRKALVVLAVAAVCLSPFQAARADEGYVSQVGWGLAAIGANLVYVPAKLTYALLGGLTGAWVYVLTVGNTEVVHRVLSPSVGGSYVLTPDMLQGKEPLLFSGESYEGE
jgi:hypothetical protein